MWTMNGGGVVLRVESDKSCQEFSSIQLTPSQLQETLLCFVDNALKKLEVSLSVALCITVRLVITPFERSRERRKGGGEV